MTACGSSSKARSDAGSDALSDADGAAGAGGAADGGGTGGLAGVAGAGGTDGAAGTGGTTASGGTTGASGGTTGASGGTTGAAGAIGDAAAPDGGDDSSASSDDGGVASIGHDVGCVPSRMLWSGADALLDAFPTQDGIIVVTPGAVSLISRTGQTLKSYTPPRPLTATAFDGTLLAVADAAFVTALTTGLESKGMIALKERCEQAVMVSAQRFVCGPMSDTSRIFYTYDLVQLALIGTSQPFTYNGVPMRRVPGRDHFVTLPLELVPADFSLYRIDPLGPVYFLGQSPYHGDFVVSTVFAFGGRPATHLVTSEGLMLQLFTPLCAPDSTSILGSDCFYKDGNIGTLWSNEMFRALASDESQDVIYGVVGTLGMFGALGCQGECKVQRIDVAQRLVIGQRGHVIGMSNPITTRHDPYCQMLMLGYSTTDTPSVNRIDLLETGSN